MILNDNNQSEELYKATFKMLQKIEVKWSIK